MIGKLPWMLFRWTWPKLFKLLRSSRPDCLFCTRKTSFKVTWPLTKWRAKTNLQLRRKSSGLALQFLSVEICLKLKIHLDIKSQSPDNLFNPFREVVSEMLKIEFHQLLKIWEKQRIPKEKRRRRKEMPHQMKSERRPKALDPNLKFGEEENKSKWFLVQINILIFLVMTM